MRNKIILCTLLMAALISCGKNGEPGTPGSGPSSEKCKASDYKQVKINNQIWMAENYRCSKYDSKSEAYKNGIRTITSSVTEPTHDAYYIDATDMEKWDKQSRGSADILSKEQLNKLGYLYNWAAVVGLDNGCNQKAEFQGNRQGICPNGWHIPSSSELYSLKKFINDNYGSGFSVAGKTLKSKSGWKQGNGTDLLEFNALPSGRAFGNSVEYVVSDTYYWTATPYSVGSSTAKFYTIGASDNFIDGTLTKMYAFSVRCVKD